MEKYAFLNCFYNTFAIFSKIFIQIGAAKTLIAPFKITL